MKTQQCNNSSVQSRTFQVSALKRKLLRKLDLLLDHEALAAYYGWPVFSSDCFHLVSALAHEGRQPRTVIDVGANTGQFAVAAAKLLRPNTIYSFEPVSECFALLERNVRDLNVKTFRLALGDGHYEIPLHVTCGKSASSCLRPMADFQSSFREARVAATVTVKASTLDRELGNVEFMSPTLLKLDVQGYEAQVLGGAQKLLKRVEWVVAETAFVARYEGETLFPEVLHMMESYGFRFVRPIASSAHVETGEIMEIDALFERKEAPFHLLDGGGGAR